MFGARNMDQIVAYLNNNSDALQALASVLTFFATIILAIITRQYVVLTRSIATTADNELRLKQKDKSVQEQRLLLLLKSFNERIAALPCNKTNGEHIREAISWENEEIETIRKLATGIGRKSGETVASLADRLKWIKEQIDMVKATNARIGFDWGLFPWSRWQDEIRSLRTDIGAMALDISIEARSAET